MRFTQLSGITPGDDDDWFDPVLSEDTPLYVDPFLVFEDQSPLSSNPMTLWSVSLPSAGTWSGVMLVATGLTRRERCGF